MTWQGAGADLAHVDALATSRPTAAHPPTNSRSSGLLNLLGVAGLFVSLGLLLGCAQRAQPEVEKPLPKAPKEMAAPAVQQEYLVRVGFFPVSDYLPYLVIKDRGMDKQFGLKFDETTMVGGAAVIEGMLGGAIDMGIVGTVPGIVAFERGLVPDKIVFAAGNVFEDENHHMFALLVRQSINDIKELEGKKIAVNARNSMNYISLRWIMRNAGIDKYDVIEMPFPVQGQAMAQGQVDAVHATEPFLTQSKLRGDGKLLRWATGIGDPNQRSQNTLVAFSAKFYKENPEAAKAYLRAHLAAVDWINKNTEQSRPLFVKYLKLDEETAAKVGIPLYKADGRSEPEPLTKLQQSMVDAKIIEKIMPSQKMYDETLLDAILKERGTARDK